jgi:hypothetical protein
MGYALPRRESEAVQVGLAVRDINGELCLDEYALSALHRPTDLLVDS